MMLRFKKIAGVILIGILPLISLSLFQVTNAEPHTEVGGPIATDTTWTLSNSPYEVVESIDVWEEATLTIEPGVILKFHAGKGMRINGELIASGSSNNPIIFTSNLDDPSPGDWGDIVFSSTATKSQIDENENYLGGSILQHCIVEYAGSTFVFSPKSAISAQSLYVDNCTVRNNSIRGISNVGSSTEPSLISNSIFQNNHPERGDGGAVYLTYGTISNSVIEDNSSNLAGGIFASNSLITNNLIQNNSSSFGGGLNAENSEIVGNKILDNESGSGGGIRAFNSTIKDNLIVDNSSEGSGGGILANDSVIESNTILNNGARNEGGGIVGGSNDILNNMIIGNTARRGAGISGNDRIISNTIAFNRSFLLVGVEDGPGIFYESFSGDQGEIFYNTIVDNYASGSDDEEIVGAITTSSFGNTPKINYNNIFNNTDYDVAVFGGDVDGTNNFWNTGSNLDILDRTFDWSDNGTVGTLTFIPYQTSVISKAPPIPIQIINSSLSVDGEGIDLSWDEPVGFNQGWEFQLYYDTDDALPPYEGKSLAIGESPISLGNSTSLRIVDFDESKTYYFAITVSNSNGLESWFSPIQTVKNESKVFLPLVVR